MVFIYEFVFAAVFQILHYNYEYKYIQSSNSDTQRGSTKIKYLSHTKSNHFVFYAHFPLKQGKYHILLELQSPWLSMVNKYAQMI